MRFLIPSHHRHAFKLAQGSDSPDGNQRAALRQFALDSRGPCGSFCFAWEESDGKDCSFQFEVINGSYCVGMYLYRFACAFVVAVDEIRHPQKMWIMNLVANHSSVFQ